MTANLCCMRSVAVLLYGVDMRGALKVQKHGVRAVPWTLGGISGVLIPRGLESQLWATAQTGHRGSGEVNFLAKPRYI